MGVLKNRVALIIGGGHGLGRAIALAYAREGAVVVVADMDPAAAQETLAHAGSHDPGCVQEVDITDVAACRELIETVATRFGRLEILVNCAAVCLVDPLLEVTPERWDEVFAVNARGTFFCMQAAAKVMMEQRFGRIINITSPASRMGFPYFASYCASKAAVDSVTRAAAVAWASAGVTVNSIAPGRMTGGMIDKLEEDLRKFSGKSAEQLKAERTEGLPMGRRVEPNEVARAAVWLASTDASYVTAERFNFSGGMELS